MNFQLSLEQKLFKQSVRKMVEGRIAPTVRQYDEKEEFPWVYVKHLNSMGLLGMAVPKEYGGMGADYIAISIAVEEVARISGSAALLMILQNGGLSRLIGQVATDEQKKKYLPKIATGEILVEVGITERNVGSDISKMKTQAIKDKQDYVIFGEKTWCSNAGVSSLYLVFAKTSPDAGTKGISVFLVEKDTPGFSVGRIEKKWG